MGFPSLMKDKSQFTDKASGPISPHRTRNTLRMMAAWTVVGASLCVMFYHQTRWLAPLHPHSYGSFQGASLGTFSSNYIGKWDLDRSWKPRVLSNYLGSLATSGDRAHFAHKAALWAASWLAAMFCLYLAFFGKESILFILGTYCGLAFGYMPGIAERLYPWDMPATFFFALFVCFLHRNRLMLFLPLLPFAVLFKETCAILCVGYLFLDATRNRRLATFATAATLALLGKGVGHLLSQTVMGSDTNFTLIASNIGYVLHHVGPLGINAGLLVALAILPVTSRHGWTLRVIAVLFAFGVMTHAVVYEYRIWFELMPISLYALHANLFANNQEVQT